MRMKMHPQLGVSSENATPEYLQYLKQMNVTHCFVMFSNDHSDYEHVNRILERIRAAGLTVDDAGNSFLYKHLSIHLGLPDRDEWIERYNALNRILGKAGVPVGYIGNSRVSHTGYFADPFTHGALGRTVHMEEILKRPPVIDPPVSEEQLWESFRYLLQAALPVAKETGMRLALHPSDPPYPEYEGYPSLIHNSDCFQESSEDGRRDRTRRTWYQVLLRLLARRRRALREYPGRSEGVCPGRTCPDGAFPECEQSAAGFYGNPGRGWLL